MDYMEKIIKFNLLYYNILYANTSEYHDLQLSVSSHLFISRKANSKF